MTDAQHIVTAARVAVRDACRVCRAVRGAKDAPGTVTKADESPVTIADFAAQAVVLHRLREHLADLRVIAEEDSTLLREPSSAPLLALVVDAVRVAWPEATPEAVLDAIEIGRGPVPPGDPYWALDPIDGTKGFLRGGQFAVCLARVTDDHPTLGLLGCPHLPAALDAPLDTPDPVGTLLIANGGTATWEPLAEGATPIPIVPRLHAADRVVVAQSYESEHSRADEIARVLTEAGITPAETLAVDSQVKYGLVARGRAHVYLRLPYDRARRDPVWDHAAGAAVAEASGMVVTDATGRALNWRQGARLEANFGILCARPDLHAGLAAAAARVLGVEPEKR